MADWTVIKQDVGQVGQVVPGPDGAQYRLIEELPGIMGLCEPTRWKAERVETTPVAPLPPAPQPEPVHVITESQAG